RPHGEPASGGNPAAHDQALRMERPVDPHPRGVREPAGAGGGPVPSADGTGSRPAPQRSGVGEAAGAVGLTVCTSAGPAYSALDMAIDTLKVARRLREAGFSEPQAEAVVSAVQEGTERADFATKADL